MTSLADGFLGAALARFHARYPNIDVKLEEATAQMNVAGVISGRLDIAFVAGVPEPEGCRVETLPEQRSEEHTSELQSLMRISYAVFCLNTQITEHHVEI